MSGAINYNVLNHERTNMLAQQFQQRLANRGTGGGLDSLRHAVLTHVIHSNYKSARDDIESYARSKHKDFPVFTNRTDRYIEHCIDLVMAIKSKREFPGLSGLPMAKQREMFEKVLDHYDELKHYLKRIEAVNAEIQIDDIRSTVYVLKTLSLCVALLLVVGFTSEIVESIYGSYDKVMTDSAKSFSDWIFNFDKF